MSAEKARSEAVTSIATPADDPGAGPVMTIAVTKAIRTSQGVGPGTFTLPRAEGLIALRVARPGSEPLSHETTGRAN